ncbi:hypothetical protein ACWDRR_43275 [Kitasatospora sp. NPDC003701]
MSTRWLGSAGCRHAAVFTPAYDQRQEAREEKARQAHRELMRTLACADCGNVPKEESTYDYELDGTWTRRPGGRCYPCHQKHEKKEKEAAQPSSSASG